VHQHEFYRFGVSFHEFVFGLMFDCFGSPKSHPQLCFSIQFILSFRYCPNGELFDFIVSSGKLPENEARKIFQQIVGGIEYEPFSPLFPACSSPAKNSWNPHWNFVAFCWL
jgi:serine/threonine protein kinase